MNIVPYCFNSKRKRLFCFARIMHADLNVRKYRLFHWNLWLIHAARDQDLGSGQGTGLA